MSILSRPLSSGRASGAITHAVTHAVALAGALTVLATLPGPVRAQAFTLASPTLQDGGTLLAEQVFQGFGCTGGDRSPALSWSGAPAGTRSFVLTVHDPDAPTGSGWWHWVLVDLPPDLRGLPAGAGAADGGALPAGAWQSRNDYGGRAFGGACPPPGDAPHRYVFTLSALKVERLGVPADASAALIGYMTRANALAQATLTVRYGR